MPTKKKLPAGISVRGGRYRVRVWYEYRQFDIGSFESLAVAKAALTQARIDIATRQFIAPAERRRMVRERQAAEAARGTTVAEWAEEWLERLANDPEHPRSPGTLASYRSTLRAHALDALGNKRLTDVSTADVNAVIAATRAVSPGAARNVAGTLRALFNAAAAESIGGLEVSPVKRLRVKASRARNDDEIPTVDEVRALAAAMPEDLRLTVWLAALLNLRVGEVLGLQRRDFHHLDDPENAELRVRRQWNSKAQPPAYSEPKSGSVGDLALPSALVPLVVAHMAEFVAERPEAPLFPSARDRTRPTSHNVLARRWNAARDTVRPGLTFHSLRHFGLTAYQVAGATPTETDRRGRHLSPTAGARYQHSSRKRDHELAELLNPIIAGE